MNLIEREAADTLRALVIALERMDPDDIEVFRELPAVKLLREWLGIEQGKRMAAEIERLTAQVERMREALGWYADTFCEYSTCNEGCGKFGDDVCAGCKARALSYRGGD